MKKILILLIFIIGGISCFYFLKKDISEPIIEKIKIEEKKDYITYLIIEDKKIKIDENLKIIDMKLEQNNMFYLEIFDPENNISFIEYDGNIMNKLENNDINIKKYQNSYEIIPAKSNITIYANQGKIYKFEVNVIYNLKNNYNSFINQWDIKQKDYKINNSNIEILKNKTELSYAKNFDYDKKKEIKINMLFKDLKNTDFKIAYGDRIYFSFDNKGIDVFLKEKINKKIENKKYVLKNTNEIKKNEEIEILFKVDVKKVESFKTIYKYSLSINGKEYEFIDEGNNKLEFERYKNFKIMFNNMNVLINDIEVKE